MIELAPTHKTGLSLANPVLIATGFFGYGGARLPFDLSLFGGMVTHPITLRPRAGPPQPRLVEVAGGFILDTGQENPGVKKVIRGYSKSWLALPVPVIAHLPADEPDDLRRTAQALAGLEGQQGVPALAAIELGLPAGEVRPRDVESWTRAVYAGSTLPLLVKFSLGASAALLLAAANAYADALVIGGPPWGTAQTPGGKLVSGYLYGPALHPLTLYQVQLARTLVELPLVAAGGIHTREDVRLLLEAGATAVQLDSLLFSAPQQAELIP
jgi:dihydroorotate dehydrogenase